VGLDEVEDAVLAGVDPGHERRPGGAGDGRQGAGQVGRYALGHEAGQVGQIPLGRPGANQVEGGAVEADDE